MARHEGYTSNALDDHSEPIDTAALFETLKDWEHQLTHSELNAAGKPKTKGPQI
jgi:hypothetical protein